MGRVKAYINGDLYTNNGSISVCYNPNGLLGGRWKFQTKEEFLAMVKDHQNKVVKCYNGTKVL